MSLNAHVNQQNNRKSWKKPNPTNSKENVLRENEKSANTANKHDKDEDVLDDALDLEEVDVHSGPHHVSVCRYFPIGKGENLSHLLL